MGQGNEKHVFVSYVHEDSAEVDKLCKVLEAAKIPYWRDRKDLGPGDAWKAKIREAIREGSLVFLACFSNNSRSKDKSHMNEELTLAVEEYRKRPPGQTWLIPVRFDSGALPDWDLGAGRSLSDHNYVDLFGDGYAAEAASLVTTIHGVMGERQLGGRAALEVVAQATAADRADLLKKLTKDMVLDPARRIELNDLVTQEVRCVLNVITDPQRVAGPIGGSTEEMIVRFATEAQELWELTKPFCASLQIAARWASPHELAPWINGMRSFVQAAEKVESGSQALLDLRHLPGLVSVMTAGLACVAGQMWSNLKALVADVTIRNQWQGKPIALLEATYPHRPFEHDDRLLTSTLAYAAQSGKPFPEIVDDLTRNRLTKFYTPVAEWLYANLRPMFEDQMPDEGAFAEVFDRAEVILGLLAQDAVNVRIEGAGGQGWGRSNWFGRSTWRAARQRGNAVDDLTHEIKTNGDTWGPLREGLFGGAASRLQVALDGYAETFEKILRQRAF